MAHLSLFLLGPFQIALAEEPVTGFESDKVRALAAFLAVEADRPHRRDSLAGLLWPDWPDRAARTNLRNALANLRTAIGDRHATPPFLLITRETIQFNTASDCWLDVAAFSALVEADQPTVRRLEEAVALYRGSFLQGFFLKDSPAFEDWSLIVRERLQRQALGALHRLAETYEQRGEYERARDYAWRQVEMEPWQEEAHQQLMRLLALSGQRGAALAQYESCRRLLAEELGVEPAAETTRLYEQIRDETLEVPPPSPARPPSPPHNLPAPLTPFVGREAELVEILDRLRDPACRLLTLVGPGGSGKTRLALEAAARQIQAPLRRLPSTPQTEPRAAGKGAPGTEPPHEPSQGCLFEDGVFFVSLGPLQSADDIVPTVAEAIGFSFYGGAGGGAQVEPRRQLLDYLQRKNLLLITDNFEHVLEGMGLVAEMLEGAPGVKVLATSRVRLRVQGEHLVPVGGMNFPVLEARAALPPAERLRSVPSHEDGRAESEDAMQYSAVKLFLVSARRTWPDFELTADNVAGVVRICRLVEGMPLGILLAAAWVGMLTPAEIADEIGRSLDFLETDLRAVPARQRSLRAAFDHSYHLLSEQERGVFQRLSVFRGGFTQDAAQQVASASLRELKTLADKSLLGRDPAGRYSIHEVLRGYAAEKLDEAPQEKAKTRDHHCGTYARFLQQREGELKGAGQGEALDEIAAEIDNVRAAWRWAIAQARVPEIRQAAESLFRYYLIRTQVQEGEEAFAQAVAALESPACQAAGWGAEREVALGLALVFQGYLGYFIYSPTRARALVRTGLEVLRPLGARKEFALAKWTAAYFDALESPAERARLARESLAIYEELGDRSGVARCYLNLGLGLAEEGYHREYLEKSLALSREIGDRWCMAFALFHLGENSLQLGAYQEAKRYHQESLAIRRQIGAHQGIQRGLDCLGFVAREQGEYGEARRLISESLTIAREIGDQLGVSGSLDLLGLVALDLEDYEEAEQRLQEGLAIRTKVGAGGETALSVQHLGDLALAVGDYEGASRNYHRSLRIWQDLDRPAGVAEAHRGLGAVHSALGDPEGARQHFRAALEMAADVGARLDILARFAALMASEGERERAAELSAFVLHHRASSRRAQNRAGRLLAELASQLPPGATAAARGRGKPKELAAVVEDVLEELRPRQA
jgi:DNA-binding SARP family transcriptional activator/predicted ATPase